MLFSEDCSMAKRIITLFLSMLLLLMLFPFDTISFAEEGKTLRIAILHEASLVKDGNAPYNADAIKDLFVSKGHQATVLSSKDFSCFDVFNAENYDLVYIPSGAAFPSSGSANLKRFFADGGRIITSGGYAFSDPVFPETDREETFGQAAYITSPAKTQSPCIYKRINASYFEGGSKFTISLQAKADNIFTDTGVAHASIYIYDASEKLLVFNDFGTWHTGSSDWTTKSYDFSVPSNAKYVDVRLGLYLSSGTMAYDDIQITADSGKTIFTEDFESGLTGWSNTQNGAGIQYTTGKGTPTTSDSYLAIFSEKDTDETGFTYDVTNYVKPDSDVTIEFEERMKSVIPGVERKTGAFLNLYQGSKLVQSIPVSQAIDSFGWHYRSVTVRTGKDSFDKAELSFGICHGTGSLDYDNIQLVCGGKTFADANGNEAVFHGSGTSKKRREKDPLWLSSNEPISVGDLLRFSSDEIPIFDIESTFSDCTSIRAADTQAVFAEGSALLEAENISGFSAITVCGNNRGRWQPLLYAYDRLGQVQGTVAAVFTLFKSPSTYGANDSINTWEDYTATAIGFFGVTSHDLFAAGNDALRDGLVALAEKMCFDANICHVNNAYDCYHVGETPKIIAFIENCSKNAETYTATYEIVEEDTGKVVFSGKWENETLPSKSRKSLRAGWTDAEFNDDFYYVNVSLYKNERLVDKYQTGFVVWNDEVVAKGPKYSYHDNYIYLQNDDGTETAIFASGVDEGGPFIMENQTPVVWKNDFAKRADAGIYIYETLQQYRGYADYNDVFASKGTFETHMRKVDSAVYLAQRYGQIYMMGMLLGQNSAVDDKQLEEDKQFIAEMAARYKDVPGIIYYLNGDLILKMSSRIDPLFRQYLTERYGDDATFQKAWNTTKTIAKTTYDTNYSFDGSGWTDNKAYDQNVFRTQLLKRWGDTLTEAAHEAGGKEKIVLCEFYSWPSESVDVPYAIGDLTYSNIGFFADVSQFAQTIGHSDQRWQDKSFGIGETNKRTHPAFYDTLDYYSSETYANARAFFFTTYLSTLAMGGNHYQVWCWKDETKYTFPWGLTTVFETCEKDSYYWFRNTNWMSRSLEPVYTVPEVAFVTPDSTRMAGSGGWYAGHYASVDALNILQGTLCENILTLNECNFDIPSGVKVIFYPLAYTMPDNVYNKLLQFVKDGGILYLSGDPSYDEILRERTKDNHLKELLGVSTDKVKYAGNSATSRNMSYSNGTITRIGSPNLTVSLSGAEALYSDKSGNPVITQFSLGSGKVVYSTDPLERFTNADSFPDDVKLYQYVLSLAGVQTAKLKASTSSIKTFVTKLKDGGSIREILNTSTADVRVELEVEGNPVKFKMGANQAGYIRTNSNGDITAIMLSGSITKGNVKYVENNAYAQIMSFDGKDISHSQKLLVMPQETKSFQISNDAEWKNLRVVYGQIFNNRFVIGGDVSYTTKNGMITFDVTSELKNKMVLLVEEDQIDSMISAVCSVASIPMENSQAETEKQASEPLSVGVIVGIIAGVVLLLAAAALFILLRKKK